MLLAPASPARLSCSILRDRAREVRLEPRRERNAPASGARVAAGSSLGGRARRSDASHGSWRARVGRPRRRHGCERRGSGRRCCLPGAGLDSPDRRDGGGRAGFVYADPDIRDEDSFVQRGLRAVGTDDVVLVTGPDQLAFLLFQFSGVRLARYDDPRVDGNDLRIRYQDPADDWDARMASGGFEPDFVVLPAEGVAAPGVGGAAGRGTYEGETWVLYEAPPKPLHGFCSPVSPYLRISVSR